MKHSFIMYILFVIYSLVRLRMLSSRVLVASRIFLSGVSIDHFFLETIESSFQERILQKISLNSITKLYPMISEMLGDNKEILTE